MKNKVTILVPFTRLWRLDAMIGQLSYLNVNNLDVNAIFIVDNKMISVDAIHNAWKRWKCTMPLIYVHNTGKKGEAEARVQPRRQRIADVMEIAKKFIPEDRDYVFVLEDDTDIRKDALLNLVNDFDLLKNAMKRQGYAEKVDAPQIKVGLVSGIQVGRWGFKMIGAWRCDNPNDPRLLETIPFTRKYLIERIDAAGFYCFLTTRKLFMEAKFEANYFGPDVNFGLELRRKGYQNFIDWTVIAGHVMKHITMLPDESCVVVEYTNGSGDPMGWKRTKP